MLFSFLAKSFELMLIEDALHVLRWQGARWVRVTVMNEWAQVFILANFHLILFILIEHFLKWIDKVKSHCALIACALSIQYN